MGISCSSTIWRKYASVPSLCARGYQLSCCPSSSLVSSSGMGYSCAISRGRRVLVERLAGNLDEEQPVTDRRDADVTGLRLLTHIEDDEILSQHTCLGNVLCRDQGEHITGLGSRQHCGEMAKLHRKIVHFASNRSGSIAPERSYLAIATSCGSREGGCLPQLAASQTSER